MNKTTQSAIDSFLSNTDATISNTHISHKAMLKNGKLPAGDYFMVMELFGNEIAAKDSLDNSIYIFVSKDEWKTKTTKERLNGLPNVSIKQKNKKWFLNGKEWNGEWIKVRPFMDTSVIDAANAAWRKRQKAIDKRMTKFTYGV